MRIFKNKEFHKWANKQHVSDKALIQAVKELNKGRFDADLGGGIYKKRVALGNRGKSAGARTFVALQVSKIGVFIYAFAKNKKENVTENELDALKKLAKIYFNFSNKELDMALRTGELVEVCDEKINS